jgi:hypothetical protein
MGKMCNFAINNNDLKKQNMIDTVDLDTKMQKEMHHQKRSTRYKATPVNGAAPDEYMTVEQFRTEAKISLTKILNEHGIY